MNESHARPMAAFWLLAVVAAVITSLGLHSAESPVAVRAGSPSPVTRSGAPELVLGGLLRAVPSSTPTRAGLWSSVSASQYSAGQAGATPTARALVSGPRSGASSTTSARASTTAPRPSATHPRPTSSPTTSTTTATATPTAQPTDAGPGKGQQGNSGDHVPPGKGAGH